MSKNLNKRVYNKDPTSFQSPSGFSRTEDPPQPQPRARLNGTALQPHVPARPQPQVHAGLQSRSYQTDKLDNVLGDFTEYFSQLRAEQRYVNEALAKLVSSAASIRETADGLTKKLKAHDGVLEKLEQSSRSNDGTRAKEIEVIKVLVGEMKSFKKTLGKSCDGDDGRTVLGRLDAVTFAVGELLERARDPEANLSNPNVYPTIIDLTLSPAGSPPPVCRTGPFRSTTHADVATSPVASTSPLKEKSLVSIPVSADIGITALTQENLELASPTLMDVDAVKPTEPTLGSQNCALTISTNSEDARGIQKNSLLSDNSSTTTPKVLPPVETIHSAVPSVMPSELASSKDAQTHKNNAGLGGSAHKSARPADNHHDHDRLFDTTPGLKPTTAVSNVSTTSTSSANPSFTEMAVQCPADKTIAALRASVARLNPYLGVLNSSVSEAEQKQKGQSQKQGPAERSKSPLSIRDKQTPSLDDMDSERLAVDTDRMDHNEENEKIRATREDLDKEEGNEEIKRIPQRVLEFNGNRNDDIDIPSPAPGLIDLTQHLRGGRSSLSPFVSSSTSLSSLSSRGRTGSRLSVDTSDDVSLSRLSSDIKLYSPNKTKVLADTSADHSLVPVVVPPEKQGNRLSSSLPPSPSLWPLSHSISSSPKVSVTPPQPSVPSTPQSRPTLTFVSLHHSPLASVPAATSKNQTQNDKTPDANRAFSFSPLSSVTRTPQPQPQLRLQSQTVNVQMPPDAQPESPSPPPLPSPLAMVMSSSCSPAVMNLDKDQPEPKSPFSSPSTHNNIAVENPREEEKESEDGVVLNLKSPMSRKRNQSIILSPSDKGVSSSEATSATTTEGAALKLKSPMTSGRSQFIIKSPSDKEGSNGGAASTPSKAAASAPTQIPSKTGPPIETLLPRDLTHISDAENEQGKAKGTDKMEVSDNFLRKRYTSLGDDADIVRIKKRKASGGSSVTDSGSSLAAKGKGNVKKEDADNPEVLKMKSGEAAANAKKPSLLNLNKGEIVAVTRVKKRKVKSDFTVNREVEGKGDHEDGLDQEKPLKRARLRVSERQTEIEPLEKGRRLTRELSRSNSGAGTLTRMTKPRSSATGSGTAAMTKVTKPRSSASVKRSSPSKGRLSRGHGKAAMEWPKMTQGDRCEDLVRCDMCKAWYHYGCVGLTPGNKCLQDGKFFFCPPCEAGTNIKHVNTGTDCCRPGCTVPPGFIVEKIIGRYKKFVDEEGLQFKYLLLWKGYSLAESTWEPEESMFDAPFMIEKFRADALQEGIDIDIDKDGLILLQVAKDPCIPNP